MVFGKVNADDEPGLAEKYHVRGIPTLLFFKGGYCLDKSRTSFAEQLRSIILELTVSRHKIKFQGDFPIMAVHLSTLRSTGTKDLHALAEQHQVDNIRNMQKQDLLFNLVKKLF